MYSITTPAYEKMQNAIRPYFKANDKKSNTAIALFVVNLNQQKSLLSSDVVLAWRDVGEEALRYNQLTFGKWCEIDKGFENYINSIFADYPDFAAEVIAQKNMDIRNGETL